MRILVIEDEADLLASLAKALREEGYVVDTAADGEDGLDKAQSWDYDALVLDVMLPRLDGWAVLERLRKTKKTPELMLTARDTSRDRVRGLDTGADDYVVKPFDLDELVARLRALIRRAAGQTHNIIEIGERLKAIGAWMKVNGEGIYGTRPWNVFGEGPMKTETKRGGQNLMPFSAQDIRFTTKNGLLYAFVLAKPTEDIVIKTLASGGGETELNRFADAVLAKAKWDAIGMEAVNPHLRYTSLPGHTLGLTWLPYKARYTDQSKVDERAMDCASWPLLKNQWVGQQINSPNLTLACDGQKLKCDSVKWMRTHSKQPL